LAPINKCDRVIGEDSQQLRENKLMKKGTLTNDWLTRIIEMIFMKSWFRK